MTEDSLFSMTAMKSMRRVFEINFFAQMLVTQYVSKLMIRQKFGTSSMFPRSLPSTETQARYPMAPQRQLSLEPQKR